MRRFSPDRYEKSRNTQIDGKQRSGIYPGAVVAIEIGKDEETGKLVEGKVVEILTVASFHPRGIKVRLEDGSVGRVRKVG